jgi:hypothetical protein
LCELARNLGNSIKDITMPAFQVKIRKSFGGRKSRDTFSNVHYIIGEHALDENETNLAARLLGNAENALLTEKVHQVGIVCKQIPSYPGEVVPKDAFFSVAMDDAGARQVAENDENMPLEVCLEFARNGVRGRAGHIYLRGGITRNETKVGADGNFILADEQVFNPFVELFTDGLLAVANQGFEYVMPCKPHVLPDGNTAIFKSVVSVNYSGITFRDRGIRRKRAENALAWALSRLLVMIAETILRIVPLPQLTPALPEPTKVVLRPLAARATAAINGADPEVRSRITIPAAITAAIDAVA